MLNNNSFPMRQGQPSICQEDHCVVEFREENGLVRTLIKHRSTKPVVEWGS